MLYSFFAIKANWEIDLMELREVLNQREKLEAAKAA